MRISAAWAWRGGGAYGTGTFIALPAARRWLGRTGVIAVMRAVVPDVVQEHSHRVDLDDRGWWGTHFCEECSVAVVRRWVVRGQAEEGYWTVLAT